jgi:hypothetical protein
MQYGSTHYEDRRADAVGATSAAPLEPLGQIDSNSNSNICFYPNLVKSIENNPLVKILQILYPWNPCKV